MCNFYALNTATMLTFKYVLIITISILAFLGMSYLIYSYIKKRNYPAKYRLLALLPLLFLGYGVYQGLVNPHSLYKSHFKEITSYELPSSANFLDYTNWGYDGTSPNNNNSLFYVKVEPDFYNQLKNKLNPSSKKLPTISKDYLVKFHKMFGEDFEDRLDFQFSRYNDQGYLIHLVGFFEEEHSLLAFYDHE